MTEEAEARAEQAAAELLAELGLDDSSNNVADTDNQVKKSKKKKGGKKKKKQEEEEINERCRITLSCLHFGLGSAESLPCLLTFQCVTRICSHCISCVSQHEHKEGA